MSLTLFTATGCARCAIAKKFMAEKGLTGEEHDATAAGKEMFAQFYRTHRSAIFRGREGIEFPVLAEGGRIRQGVAGVIAWLQAGARLDGFIGPSELSRGWVGGLHISGGDLAALDELVVVLGYLKNNGLKLQLDTDGRNAAVLECLLDQRLGDRAVMDLKGPRSLYAGLLGTEVDPREVERTMRLVARFPEFRFETTVAPVRRVEGNAERSRHLTAEEVAETAEWLKAATGSHRQPYVLRSVEHHTHPDDRFRGVDMPAPDALFRHRTAARRHQVLTEIETTRM